jgi:hypothetical protein
MSKKSYRWMGLRHPKTTKERRENQDGWNRFKRNHLPQAYDDISRTIQRSWKSHRKNQYHRIKSMNHMELNLNKFANDLKNIREQEITLSDLTESQWQRVCNRIACCLNNQIFPFDWEKFMDDCGMPKDREVC